ncbi:hypothetical protein IEQ34_008824 [Dendrobium chrysotoxum]|uniref:Uncharacterized protein n=1 Tax=Dendrobium chrysotoxum TaxID=161865 RepID=A0AAV7GHL9_DENCH|nr:hypothetical protein IEQ34_008824 [Dendrobium chrysotoxum]
MINSPSYEIVPCLSKNNSTIYVIFDAFLLTPLCVLSFLVYILFKIFMHVDTVKRFLENKKSLSPSRYSYNEIMTITNNFKDKLGHGGFGFIFKRRLLGGYLVTVKMLEKSMGDGENFINEVSTINFVLNVLIELLINTFSLQMRQIESSTQASFLRLSYMWPKDFITYTKGVI